jgi:hypothetical protein
MEGSCEYISSRGQPTVGGPPAWGLGGGLTTLPRKTQYLLRITTLSIHEEIKSRLNSGNACYHSVQSFVIPPDVQECKS